MVVAARHQRVRHLRVVANHAFCVETKRHRAQGLRGAAAVGRAGARGDRGERPNARQGCGGVEAGRVAQALVSVGGAPDGAQVAAPDAGRAAGARARARAREGAAAPRGGGHRGELVLRGLHAAEDGVQAGFADGDKHVALLHRA